MFSTLFRKELLEQWRTRKALIFGAVMLVSGLFSPLLAKITPVILKAIPDLPTGLAGLIPEPTITDAVGQYIKNGGQFGLLLVIVLTMGTLAQEKERGTAAMLLTKPVRRSALILAKWLAGMLVVLAGVLPGALGGLLYTALLFEPLSAGGFLALNALLCVYLAVFMSVALLASTLARSQGMAALGAFGGLILVLFLGALPRIDALAPGRLLEWGASLALGEPFTAWPALVAAAALCALCLTWACWHFEREEI